MDDKKLAKRRLKRLQKMLENYNCGLVDHDYMSEKVKIVNKKGHTFEVYITITTYPHNLVRNYYVCESYYSGKILENIRRRVNAFSNNEE